MIERKSERQFSVQSGCGSGAIVTRWRKATTICREETSGQGNGAAWKQIAARDIEYSGYGKKIRPQHLLAFHPWDNYDRWL
jgi:hypothetical protein